MKAALKLLSIAAFAASTVVCAQSSAKFNAEGLRSSHYRAPLPEYVPGGTTVNAIELKQLLKQQDVALVDVQAITLRPETAEFDMDWLPSSVRLHLPGSVWLPNVGYGEIDDQIQSFFERELMSVSQGQLHRAIVFYCVADCWMSWNSVQRAAKLGYSNLFWFPEGTDGWQEQGYALVEATPQPLYSSQ